MTDATVLQGDALTTLRGIPRLAELTDTAIGYLRLYCPPEGYFLAFSGGKDSLVAKILCILARVKFESHLSHTGLEPPELLAYIRAHHQDTIFDRPKRNWVEGVVAHGLPLRHHPWCCRELKEGSGRGRVVVTGVRREESKRREGYEVLSPCPTQGKVFVSPIVKWTEKDVWAFIRALNLPYCCLYDEGFTRIGCIGCPQGRKQRFRQFKRWPRMERAWQKAARLAWEVRRERGITVCETWEEYFRWWLSDRALNAAQPPLFAEVATANAGEAKGES